MREDLKVDGYIDFKSSEHQSKSRVGRSGRSRNRVEWHGQDLPRLAEGLITGFCERGNEHSDLIKFGIYLE
jgi:hypothetical protein